MAYKSSNKFYRKNPRKSYKTTRKHYIKKAPMYNRPASNNRQVISLVHNTAFNYWHFRFRPVVLTGHMGHMLFANISNTFTGSDTVADSKLKMHSLWNYQTLQRFDSVFLSRIEVQFFVPQDAAFSLILKKFSKNFTVHTDTDSTKFLDYVSVYSEFDDRNDSNQIVIPQSGRVIKYTLKNKFHDGLIYQLINSDIPTPQSRSLDWFLQNDMLVIGRQNAGVFGDLQLDDVASAARLKETYLTMRIKHTYVCEGTSGSV